MKIFCFLIFYVISITFLCLSDKCPAEQMVSASCESDQNSTQSSSSFHILRDILGKESDTNRSDMLKNFNTNAIIPLQYFFAYDFFCSDQGSPNFFVRRSCKLLHSSL